MSDRTKEHVESVLLPEDHAADTGHVYDGIAELDHRLPAWWLFTLWAAIAFAIVYWAYYHTTGIGPSAREVYASEFDEMKKQEAEREAKMIASGQGFTDDALKAHAAKPEAVARGKDVYMTNCQACHKADGAGLIGPNLTDNVALYGGKPSDLYRIISEGSVAKGMPAWKPVLGVEKMRDVVAFLQTMPPATGGKEPQGNPIDGSAAPAPVEVPGGAAPDGTAAPEGAAPVDAVATDGASPPAAVTP
jgi:cytochrome c oxidase cbb3-type subunit 3